MLVKSKSRTESKEQTRNCTLKRDSYGSDPPAFRMPVLLYQPCMTTHQDASIQADKTWLTAFTMHAALIPYLSSSSAGLPLRGISLTASFLTVMSRHSPTAEHTASPIPPVIIRTSVFVLPISFLLHLSCPGSSK